MHQQENTAGDLEALSSQQEEHTEVIGICWQSDGCRALCLGWVDAGVNQRHFDVGGASDDVEVGDDVPCHIPDEAGPCALGHLQWCPWCRNQSGRLHEGQRSWQPIFSDAQP